MNAKTVGYRVVCIYFFVTKKAFLFFPHALNAIHYVTHVSARWHAKYTKINRCPHFSCRLLAEKMLIDDDHSCETLCLVFVMYNDKTMINFFTSIKRLLLGK